MTEPSTSLSSYDTHDLHRSTAPVMVRALTVAVSASSAEEEDIERIEDKVIGNCLIFGVLLVIIFFACIQLMRICRSSSGKSIVHRLEEKKKNEKVGTYSKYATEDQLEKGLDIGVEFSETEVMEQNQYMSELTLEVVRREEEEEGGETEDIITIEDDDATWTQLMASSFMENGEAYVSSLTEEIRVSDHIAGREFAIQEAVAKALTPSIVGV